jgi:hypothetical protein
VTVVPGTQETLNPARGGVLTELQACASCATDPESGRAGLALWADSIQDHLERIAACACGSSEGLVAGFAQDCFDAGSGVIIRDEISVHDSLPFSSRVSPALMGSVSVFRVKKA